jgi:hypothetical protein
MSRQFIGLSSAIFVSEATGAALGWGEAVELEQV